MAGSAPAAATTNHPVALCRKLESGAQVDAVGGDRPGSLHDAKHALALGSSVNEPRR